MRRYAQFSNATIYRVRDITRVPTPMQKAKSTELVLIPLHPAFLDPQVSTLGLSVNTVLSAFANVSIIDARRLFSVLIELQCHSRCDDADYVMDTALSRGFT